MYLIKKFDADDLNGEKCVIFKFMHLTSFAFVVKDVAEICSKYINIVTKDMSLLALSNICEQMHKDIFAIVAEKNMQITYCTICVKSKEYLFNIYKHKKLHGHNYPHACEKICILLSETRFSRIILFDSSAELMGFQYSNVFNYNVTKVEGSFNPLLSYTDSINSVEACIEVMKITSKEGKIRMIYVL